MHTVFLIPPQIILWWLTCIKGGAYSSASPPMLAYHTLVVVAIL